MRADSVTPRPAIGSSSSSNCGLVASATASSSSRCSPWLSSDTGTSARASEPYPLQRSLRGIAQMLLLARSAPEAERVPVMGLRGERDIVGRGEIRQQGGDLERARQPEPAAPIGRQPGDVAAGCAVETRRARGIGFEVRVQAYRLPARQRPQSAESSDRPDRGRAATRPVYPDASLRPRSTATLPDPPRIAGAISSPRLARRPERRRLQSVRRSAESVPNDKAYEYPQKPWSQATNTMSAGQAQRCPAPTSP